MTEGFPHYQKPTGLPILPGGGRPRGGGTVRSPQEAEHWNSMLDKAA